LRQLFGVAYFPGLVNEGEPATGDRQALVNGIFGDIFDVLTNAEVKGAVDPARILNSYKAVVVGGNIEWSKHWVSRLQEYVKSGGTVVLNAAQIKTLPSELIGVKLRGASAESDSARCGVAGEHPHDLTGQMFRYEKLDLKGALPLMTSAAGDPLVTMNKVGKGSVIFAAVPDLLGHDERITPFAAHMLAHVFNDATPVKVRGDVEYLINKNANGWVVTLLNNNGVYKPAQGMAQVDRSAYVTTTISLPGTQIQSAVDWINDKPVEVIDINNDGAVRVRIAPGSVAVVQLIPRNTLVFRVSSGSSCYSWNVFLRELKNIHEKHETH
jgi:hypothetical protein